MMFDEDSQVNEQVERCERCDCGGIYCDEESGDWLCDNCTHNYSHAEEDAPSSKHIPLFKTEQGEEIERLKAELAELTAENERLLNALDWIKPWTIRDGGGERLLIKSPSGHLGIEISAHGFSDRTERVLNETLWLLACAVREALSAASKGDEG